MSKVFDSVSHHVISALARRVNTPTKILKYINNLYNNNIINIKIDQKKSNPIRICRGVKQGDPLSPIIFNSVMDHDSNVGRWCTSIQTLHASDIGLLRTPRTD